jgi:hypothetical protein
MAQEMAVRVPLKDDLAKSQREDGCSARYIITSVPFMACEQR